jgi:FkbM family methyltransferase
LISALQVHWEARKRYAGVSNWMLHVYNRLLRRLPSTRLPGRNRVARIKLRGHQDPFLLRLGTTDWLVLEEIFHKGEYTFVEKHVPRAARIVDLGANVGFSLRYWNRLFPKAKILAVEPDPENCRLCLSNAKAAGFEDRLTLVQACVGAHAREVQLVGTEAWEYRMRDTQLGTRGTVEVIPFDELLGIHANGRDIDLLKCDIEGAEAELFGHCRAWIERVRNIAIELHPPYSFEEFHANLRRAGAEFELVAQVSTKQFPVVLLRRAGSGHSGRTAASRVRTLAST